MATGYEDIDKVMQQQNSLLEQQQQQGNKVIDLGLQKAQAQVDKQKTEYEQEAVKTGKQLYTDYRKVSNPYGATAEQLASQGLNKSGYAESTQTQLYNTYQKNATTLMVETQKLKAEADFQMNQAFIDADIQKAQNAIQIYQQKAQLALQEYDMKFSREQFNFQREQFEYQKQRDAESDRRWQQEFELSLAKSKKASGSGNGGLILDVSEPLSENAQSILNGYRKQNIKNANENTKNKAREKIFYDYEWGRITDNEAKYLMNHFDL